MMIGRVPGTEAARKASSWAGSERAKTFRAPAAKLPASDVRKNLRRDQISIAMPPRGARAIYKRKAEKGSCAGHLGHLGVCPDSCREVDRLRNSEGVGYLVFLPHAKTAEKGILIVAEARSRRQLLQFLAVSAAQHHVVRIQRGLQLLGNFGHTAAPLFCSHSFEAAQSQIVLVAFAVFIGQMRQLHGLQNSVDDHRRSQPGSQSEKQHPAAFVTPNRLHGGIVQDFYRAAKRFLKFESHPTRAQVVRLAKRMPIDDGPRIAERNAV